MTYEETAELLDGMLYYWPGLMRDNDVKNMTQAWAVALRDIPLNAAKRGCAVLAGKLKFLPKVADVVDAAQPFIPHQIESFDVLFARSCHDCLGFDTLIYKQMRQGRVQAPERLKLN